MDERNRRRRKCKPRCRCKWRCRCRRKRKRLRRCMSAGVGVQDPPIQRGRQRRICERTDFGHEGDARSHLPSWRIHGRTWRSHHTTARIHLASSPFFDTSIWLSRGARGVAPRPRGHRSGQLGDERGPHGVESLKEGALGRTEGPRCRHGEAARRRVEAPSVTIWAQTVGRVNPCGRVMTSRGPLVNQTGPRGLARGPLMSKVGRGGFIGGSREASRGRVRKIAGRSRGSSGTGEERSRSSNEEGRTGRRRSREANDLRTVSWIRPRPSPCSSRTAPDYFGVAAGLDAPPRESRRTRVRALSPATAWTIISI
jgi:hypothetical protein